LVKFARSRGFNADEIKFATCIFDKVKPGTPPAQTNGPKQTPAEEGDGMQKLRPNHIQALCKLLEGLQAPKTATAINVLVPRSVVSEARHLARAVAEDARHREELNSVRRQLKGMAVKLDALVERSRPTQGIRGDEAGADRQTASSIP
jgi:hypothetical protein